MAFEDLDTDDEKRGVDLEGETEEEKEALPEESNNRTFVIIAGVVGLLIIVGIICIAVYWFLFRPSQLEQQAAAIATNEFQNTQVAIQVEQTATAAVARVEATSQALIAGQTATAVAIIEMATNTPVVVATTEPTQVVAAPTEVAGATPDPRTATVSALLTQVAITTQTVVPTSTALPQTGFADEVGLPLMLGLALLLVFVIVLARRLRTA